MTEPELRKKVMDLIVEAVEAGARLSIACEEAEISTRTYNRWRESFEEHQQHIDKRTIAVHPEPHNKLSDEEVEQILKVVNLPEFRQSAAKPDCADTG